MQLIAVLAKTAPSVKVPPELKTNGEKRRWCSHWSQKHFKPNIYVYSVCKIDGNAVAHSILPVSKLVRKQDPLKIKK